MSQKNWLPDTVEEGFVVGNEEGECRACRDARWSGCSISMGSASSDFECVNGEDMSGT